MPAPTVNAKSTTRFLEYPSIKQLDILARQPIDFTIPSNFTPTRLEHFVAEACGYRFLYGTERVSDDVMKALVGLAEEAQVLGKMQRMQDGAVLNLIHGFPSENRSVLHTATRDFFDDQNQGQEAISAAKQAKQEVDKLKAFITKIDKENKFTDLVSIGIGGSDLGPRAHYIALEHLLKKGRRVHFISNVDPDDAAMVLKGLDLKKTVVVVVSKTGSTLETRANEEFVRAYFAKAGIDSQQHFISVTSQGSPMDDRSRYLESFYIWDWIGGRYSTTSMVGGVMLSFAFGFDVYWDLLKGANGMDKVALKGSIKENLPLLGALLSVWNRNFLHYPTLALIPYSQALSRYSAHIQQVEMESNGKHVDQEGRFVNFNTGPIIWGEPGTNAQHSFYQLIHQGTDIIPLEFIGFKKSQCGEDHIFEGTSLQQKLLANLFAQAIALATGQKSDNPNREFSGNRPSHIILGSQLTPYALGALLGYFENKVAFEGFIWGVNSFDQEGVQLGKVLANKLIDRLANPQKGESYPLGDALIKQLGMLKNVSN
ncbi:MAG: glucose-6-phosphate isomerase [Parachlamydiaceae bacterium]